MNPALVVTFTGPDRPGIVDALSRVVAEHGGNWEESRMATLAGRFAGILKVTVPDAREAALVSALRAVPNLQVTIDRGSSAPVARDARRVHLHVTGQDREGIVRDVAGVLVSRLVNIEEMTSEQVSAPMSGDLLFVAFVRLDVPPQVALEDLATAIEALADDLVVEFPAPEE